MAGWRHALLQGLMKSTNYRGGVIQKDAVRQSQQNKRRYRYDDITGWQSSQTRGGTIVILY